MLAEKLARRAVKGEPMFDPNIIPIAWVVSRSPWDAITIMSPVIRELDWSTAVSTAPIRIALHQSVVVSKIEPKRVLFFRGSIKIEII